MWPSIVEGKSLHRNPVIIASQNGSLATLHGDWKLTHDREGKAVSADGYGLDLNYIYIYQPRLRFVVNAGYGQLESDTAHPIYGVKDDSTRYGLALAAFFAQPFGLEGWVLNVSAAAFEDDHEIRFYDTSVRLLTVGMLRRF